MYFKLNYSLGTTKEVYLEKSTIASSNMASIISVMTKTPQDQPKEESKERWTQFGYALACFGLAVFCFGAPSFFNFGTIDIPFSNNRIDSTVGTTSSIVCYFAGAIFSFYTVSFLLNSFEKHPEVRRYLRSLFGGSADAWDSALGSVSLIVVASVVYLLAVVLFGASGIVALLIKMFVYFFSFMGFVLGVSAVDTLVFKPFLHSIADRPPDRAAVSRKAAKVAVAVGTGIATLATLLAALSELTN